MEVFRGSPQDRDFQEWFERLRRNKRGNIVAVAVDAIPCHKARAILERTSSLQHPIVEEDFKKAIIHMVTCWDRGCKAILSQFSREHLKAS